MIGQKLRAWDIDLQTARIPRREFGEFGKRFRLVGGDIENGSIERRPHSSQPRHVPGCGRDPEFAVTEIGAPEMDRNDCPSRRAQPLESAYKNVSNLTPRRE